VLTAVINFFKSHTL